MVNNTIHYCVLEDINTFVTQVDTLSVIIASPLSLCLVGNRPEWVACDTGKYTGGADHLH